MTPVRIVAWEDVMPLKAQILIYAVLAAVSLASTDLALMFRFYFGQGLFAASVGTVLAATGGFLVARLLVRSTITRSLATRAERASRNIPRP